MDKECFFRVVSATNPANDPRSEVQLNKARAGTRCISRVTSIQTRTTSVIEGVNCCCGATPESSHGVEIVWALFKRLPRFF